MSTYTFENSDLASRTLAARERELILSKVAQGKDSLVLDFKNVKSLSESFADELFGILALTKGLSFVMEKFIFSNTQEHVLRSIAVSIDRRINTKQNP